MHANIILSQDLLDYSPLFVEIADAYFDREMYAEASPLYELLGQDAAVWLSILPSTRADHGALDKQFRYTSECGSLPAYAGKYARSGGPL